MLQSSLNHQNSYIFRIFGCFGKHEVETRFIKNSLNNIKNNKNIIVFKDKYIDYISANDLCKILEYYINNSNLDVPKDINLVYEKKIKLSELGEKILNFKDSRSCVNIQELGLDKSYTGDGSRLASLPIKLSGLDKSLEDLLCQF